MAEVHQSYGFPLSFAIKTDVGRVRTNNEDSNGGVFLEDGSLFCMVADGMGGHEAGEVASGLAVQVVEEFMTRDPRGDPRDRLYNALLEANEAILEEGRRSGKAGMGTTSIVTLTRGSEVTVALVGDSRCYQIRKGQMVWRTTDHTRVQMLVDSGEIDEDAARVHPEAGMLTRALGHGRMADGRPLVPDVIGEPLHLEPDDALVLCSDGLHDLLEDWEVCRLVGGRTPEEAAEALVELACERGGHDNVTVAVVLAGERAADYDAHFRPPKPDPSEDTYPGADGAPETYSMERDKSAGVPPPTGVFGAGATRGGPPAAPAAGGSNTMMIVGGVVVLLVVLGGGALLLVAALGGAFFLSR